MTYVQKNLYPEFDIRNNIVIYNKKFKKKYFGPLLPENFV